jgi:predicted ATPase
VAIKKISVSNFKSFDNLQIELGRFNLLIGANASGKSNFTNIFRFLKDTASIGLDYAISMQGGLEYLRNMKIGHSKSFSLELVCDDKWASILGRTKEKKLVGMRVYETNYKISIRFRKKGAGYEIAEDKLTHQCELLRMEIRARSIEEKESIGKAVLTFSRGSRGKVDFAIEPAEAVPIGKDQILPSVFLERRLPPNALLLQSPFMMFLPSQLAFKGISIYDFDPKLSKKAVPINGKIDLAEDGSNLAVVLNNILKSGKKRRKFSNLLTDLLPFVVKLDASKLMDKSLLLKLRETYHINKYLPATQISDGTLNIAALVIALYFAEKAEGPGQEELLTIIEEPERNIHPKLISKVLDMMKEASKTRQIIATTHNPEMVKHADIDDILLVSRSKDGFSMISRPREKPVLKEFLKDEIGIEELYVQDLLGS